MEDRTVGNVKSPKQQLAAFEEVLDRYVNGVVPKPKIPSEVLSILDLSYEDLKKLTREQCAEYSLLLAQYSFYIQTEINRNKSRLTWAEHNLNLIVAQEYERYAQDRFAKYDLVRAKICVDNSAARVLNNIILHAKCRVQELENIANKIYFISKMMSNLGYTRGGD